MLTKKNEVKQIDMKLIHNLLIIVAILAFACIGNSKKDAAPLEGIVPIIDITKKYPSKDLFVEDVFEVSYIPLRASENVLLDGSEQIAYHSTDKIIVYNSMNGNVFIFDDKGKVVSQFNDRGQSGEEYNQIKNLIYDDKNQEIIIQDEYSNLFLVYNENGKYKRSLPYPKNCDFKDVLNYNEEMLIAYENNFVDDVEKNHLARKKPFVFLSKQDGSIVSDINIKLVDRISTAFKMATETGSSTIKVYGPTILMYDKGFVLNEVSSDTIFYFDEEHILSPLLIRQPAIGKMYNPKTVMFLYNVTKEYMMISSFINEYNFKNQKRGEKVELIFDRNSGEVFSYKLSYRDLLIDDLKVTPQPYMLLPADILIEFYEQNKLGGELKEIAAQLDPDDNPVLMIAK